MNYLQKSPVARTFNRLIVRYGNLTLNVSTQPASFSPDPLPRLLGICNLLSTVCCRLIPYFGIGPLNFLPFVLISLTPPPPSLRFCRKAAELIGVQDLPDYLRCAFYSRHSCHYALFLSEASQNWLLCACLIIQNYSRRRTLTTSK
jgi:hypothetical protein